MTAAEATTIRTAALAALTGNADISVQSMGVSGRNLTRFSPKELMDLIATCDQIIGQAANGSFSVAQFRDSE